MERSSGWGIFSSNVLETLTVMVGLLQMPWRTLDKNIIKFKTKIETHFLKEGQGHLQGSTRMKHVKEATEQGAFKLLYHIPTTPGNCYRRLVVVKACSYHDKARLFYFNSKL